LNSFRRTKYAHNFIFSGSRFNQPRVAAYADAVANYIKET